MLLFLSTVRDVLSTPFPKRESEGVSRQFFSLWNDWKAGKRTRVLIYHYPQKARGVLVLFPPSALFCRFSLSVRLRSQQLHHSLPVIVPKKHLQSKRKAAIPPLWSFSVYSPSRLALAGISSSSRPLIRAPPVKPGKTSFARTCLARQSNHPDFKAEGVVRKSTCVLQRYPKLEGVHPSWISEETRRHAQFTARDCQADASGCHAAWMFSHWGFVKEK